MANKARKTQSAPDTIVSNHNSNPVTQTKEVSMNNMPASELNASANGTDNQAFEIEKTLTAGTEELLEGAQDVVREDDDAEIEPDEAAARIAFNVYRSSLPETEGRIFSILYFNPLHTYPAEDAKDENVVRLFTNRKPDWRVTSRWLAVIADFEQGKYAQVSPDGFAVRQNGNIVVATDLYLQNATILRSGMIKLEGITEEPIYISGFNGKVREGQLYIEFKKEGRSYSFYSAANQWQTLYYDRLMKIASGANVYIRRLDSKTRPMPMARIAAMREETVAKYVDVNGSYFFKAPLAEFYAQLMQQGKEEARETAQNHIKAAVQGRAIKAQVRRDLAATKDEEGKTVVVIEPKQGLKLLVKPNSKLPEGMDTTTDEKGNTWLDIAQIDRNVGLIGFNKTNGLPANVFVTLQFGENIPADINQQALATLNRAGASIMWSVKAK